MVTWLPAYWLAGDWLMCGGFHHVVVDEAGGGLQEVSIDKF